LQKNPKAVAVFLFLDEMADLADKRVRNGADSHSQKCGTPYFFKHAQLIRSVRLFMRELP
jgi:hypothetical protein